jgi:hypothetical protein
MSDHPTDPTDDALSQRLATELRRHAAPPHVRAAILRSAVPRSRVPVWLAPLLAASATALVLALVGVELLPRSAPTDPTQSLLRAVVSEHSRAIMWGTRRAEIVPTALPQLAEESGVEFSRVFVGDDRLTFVAAEPVYLNRTRGVAFHYREPDGHLVTYVAVPAPRLAVPDRARVAVDRFRPALLRDGGFASWVWKQGDHACFLVSDMVSPGELDRFKDYFLRVRIGTDPVPGY